jgi:sugar-phosphatase
MASRIVMADEATRLRLLFDLDGTLVDSSSSVEQHWRRWARLHGRDDPERVLAVVHGHRSIDAIRLLAPSLDAVTEAARVDAEQAADARGVTAMPHAAELLASLARDDWAIVTSATRALATARLAAANLPAPQVIVCAEDVVEGKPAPDGYLKAAHQLGASPTSCVVIEDAPSGIEAGRRAGIATLAVATTHPRSALTDADALIRDLSEVLDVCRDIKTPLAVRR